MPWVIFIGILLLIGWIATMPWLAWSLFLIACAAAIYALYRCILNSQWLQGHEREQRWAKEKADAAQLAEEAATKARLEATTLAIDWATTKYRLPSDFDFENARILNPPKLHPQLLWKLISLQKKAFNSAIVDRMKITPEIAYDQYLRIIRASVAGLEAFAKDCLLYTSDAADDLLCV